MRNPEPRTRRALLALAGAATLVAAADPIPGDFVVAAEFAAALLSAGGPGARNVPVIVSRERQPVPFADYRRLRVGCELNRLSRVSGRAEISVEWRCGPLNARWNDVFVLEHGRVTRIEVNVFLTQTPALPRPQNPPPPPPRN